MNTGEPLLVVQFDLSSNKVVAHEENLQKIQEALLETNATLVQIVSIIGSYRTGKSFLLDLLMRYLRYSHEPSAGSGFKEWTYGKSTETEIPAWMYGPGADHEYISEGLDNNSGFTWRGGMDKCTEGIWMWSQPFIRTYQSRKVALLLMDTQGAWDSSMSKEQSATVFGLTAILSTKLIYNIQNRVTEDRIDNLDYFTTFAQAALSELPRKPLCRTESNEEVSLGEPSLGHWYPPATSTNPEDCEFGSLEFVVRDWEHFEETWNASMCVDQMLEHLDSHINTDNITNPSRCEIVERLKASFNTVGCFGLPHPGRRIPRHNWEGSIQDIDPDFLKLLDILFTDMFSEDQFVLRQQVVGQHMLPEDFGRIMTTFISTFKDARPDAVSLRDAFVACECFKARAWAVSQFKVEAEALLPAGAVRDQKALEVELTALRVRIVNKFAERIAAFNPSGFNEKVLEVGKVGNQTIQTVLHENDQRYSGVQFKAVGCTSGVFLFGSSILSGLSALSPEVWGTGLVGGGLLHWGSNLQSAGPLKAVQTSWDQLKAASQRVRHEASSMSVVFSSWFRTMSSFVGVAPVQPQIDEIVEFERDSALSVFEKHRKPYKPESAPVSMVFGSTTDEGLRSTSASRLA